MNDDPIPFIPAELPKPKKRTGWPKGKPRPRKAANVVPMPKPKDDLAGLTAYDCCDGCNAERCVITETPFCAHPFKSPLQTAFLNKPEIVKRYNKAKAYLAGQKVDVGRYL